MTIAGPRVAVGATDAAEDRDSALDQLLWQALTVGDTVPTPVAKVASERLELVVDTMQEYAIFVLDQAGTVVTWNPGARRIKGYTAEEIIGQHFSVFYTTEDIAAGKPQHELALAAAEGVCRDDGWRVRKDGSRFWATVVISALVGADGRLEGFSKVTRDETDRRQAEQQALELQRLVDREAIGSGLGDTVVRHIFDAGLDLHSALTLVADPVAIQRIEHAIEVLDATVKEIRLVVLGLNPEST